MKEKKCKVCQAKFTPYKSTQIVCSPKCAKKFEIIRKRIAQEKYRKKNWEIIKKKKFNYSKKKNRKRSQLYT